MVFNQVLPGHLHIMLENFLDFLFQLAVNFRQEIWFDSVEKQIILSSFVDFVHFFMQVIVDSGNSVNLVCQHMEFFIHPCLTRKRYDLYLANLAKYVKQKRFKKIAWIRSYHLHHHTVIWIIEQRPKKIYKLAFQGRNI